MRESRRQTSNESSRLALRLAERSPRRPSFRSSKLSAEPYPRGEQRVSFGTNCAVQPLSQCGISQGLLDSPYSPQILKIDAKSYADEFISPKEGAAEGKVVGRLLVVAHA